MSADAKLWTVGIQIRLNRWKSARHFKATFCATISDFESLSRPTGSRVSAGHAHAAGEKYTTFSAAALNKCSMHTLWSLFALRIALNREAR